METTSLLTPTGWPFWYTTLTWVLPSGRSQGRSPPLRTIASRSARRWARTMGSGMREGVSSVAYPNIIPWSPAPPVSTPRAMSADCRSIVVITAQVWASKPKFASV